MYYTQSLLLSIVFEFNFSNRKPEVIYVYKKLKKT